MRLSDGARMVTKRGKEKRESSRRKTANLESFDSDTPNEPPPVPEEEKVNPSGFHEHCTICNVEFDLTPDGTPRVLDCGHRFCTKCLRLLLKTAENGSGGDKLLLCPRNYVATDDDWHAPNKAANWAGEGRAGLVLQNQIVGDKRALRAAAKQLEQAKEHVDAEIRRQQAVRDNSPELLPETESENTRETEADFAKSLQHLETRVAEAEEAYEQTKTATVVKPMKPCTRGDGNGQTVVREGKVENLSKKLSMTEETKADAIQLVQLAQAAVRVGPPGPLNPAFEEEIVHRLTNQVSPPPSGRTASP